MPGLQIGSSGEVELILEEITIRKGSKLDGSTLRETRIREELGLVVIAINRLADPTPFEFNPSPDLRFEVGDVILTMGPLDNLRRLENWAGIG